MSAMPNVFDLPTPEPEGRPDGQMAGIRKVSGGSPDLDRFLEDFISGREPQTTQWIRLASLVASQSFSCDVVVRVLRANEKTASGTLPIDKLGVSIARKTGAKYSPGRLKRIEGRAASVAEDPGGSEESRERFSFDKSFLPASARVLVIGDHETPPPTYEAIRKSIAAQLPNAEVKSFTLHWLEQHFRSALLDDRYFLTSESPLSVLSRQANPHRPEVPQEPAIVESEEAVDSVLSLMPPPAEETAEATLSIVPAAPRPSAVVPRSPGKRPVPAPAGKSRFPSWLLLVGLGIVVLGVGLVVVAEKRGVFSAKFQGADASVIPEPSEAPMTAPPAVQSTPAPVSVPVAEARPRGPQGIITVPSAGLRSGPSLDSKLLRKSVRGNERVTILKRRSSNAGPGWVQIETKGGVVGWVWASVVREGKRR